MRERLSVLQLGPYPPPHGGVQTNLVAIREQICSAVDVIVQQTRFSCGSRKVTSIAEVTGMESGKIQPFLVRFPTGR